MTGADAVGYVARDEGRWEHPEPLSPQEAHDRTAGGHCGVALVEPTAPTAPAAGQVWVDDDDLSQGVKAFVTITGNTTLDDTHAIVYCDASSGGFTVTLPPAADHAGRRYYIVRIDNTGNAVTIDGDGSETINDQLEQRLDYPNSLTLHSRSTEWRIL